MQISEISNPIGTVCKKAVQFVTVKVMNNGSVAQKNIPLTLNIKNGSTTVLDVTEIFTGRLNGLESMSYTFQKPFSIQSGLTYNITASVNLTGDQQPANNSFSDVIVSSSAESVPTGTATVCNSSLKLTVGSPVSGTNYYWYDSSNLVSPIGIGASTNVISTKNKVYLSKGYQGFIGPATNTTLNNSGGYNTFSGNYVKINTTSALTIETTKLYTGYPGKMDIILATLATSNADGSYSYYPIQTVSLNVPASSPNPVAVTSASGTAFVVGDTGRVYALNLKVPQAGDYILIMKCDSASVFRNNGTTDPTYPIGPTKVFSFTGNSVATPSNYQNYFYFFYNTQISTNDCYNPSAVINVATAQTPTVVQVADSLVSSIAANYQWYMNDEIVPGATKQSYKPLKNAMYKVQASTADCQIFSDNKLILITDVAEASAKEIKLKISSDDYVENMIKGNSFYVQFSNVQTQGISLEIMNSMGSNVFTKQNLNNQSTPQHITIPSLNTGIYFVKIYANKKVYVQRVLLTNN
jgi:hypothetical protein